LKIISIETATDICGVALIKDDVCVDIVEDKTPRKHAEVLPLFTEKLIKRNQLSLKNIDGIALSHGPGSFTGLRIGMSYSKGLAYSHNLPIIPVPTLEAIAYGQSSKKQDRNIILYSHGKMVFYDRFDRKSSGKRPKSCEWNEVPFERSGQWYHYGCDHLISEHQPEMLEAIPSAEWIGLLAVKYFHDWAVVDPKDLEPDYISPFNLQKKKV